MMFTKEELIKVTGAEVLSDNCLEEDLFSISTDTRSINEKNIYLPLKGEKFDGEDFIQSALNAGAKAYFTTKDDIFSSAKLILKVKDTKKTYIEIAKYYRNKVNPITVGITGSAGKTTTKELVYSVLKEKFKTQKTFSNHNNEIGFCQTVLGMKPDTEALIVEMGMRGLGEIEEISVPLNPDFAIITNCGSAHIGRLGSMDNIAIAKCEIAKGLKSNGVFISLNQDIIKKHLNFDGEKIFYSLKDVKILSQAPSYSKFEYKNYIYELNVEGDYNIENSLSAIELGLKLNMSEIDIAKGLYSYKPIEKRWELETVNGLNFVNDSYNANPESMKASVKTFVQLYQNPVVVLGDMGELGQEEEILHRQVGEFLSKLNKNVKYIIIGKLASKIGNTLEKCGFSVNYFNDNYDAACYIVENFDNSNTIFLKASRSMKFEEIIENIKKM